MNSFLAGGNFGSGFQGDSGCGLLLEAAPTASTGLSGFSREGFIIGVAPCAISCREISELRS